MKRTSSLARTIATSGGALLACALLVGCATFKRSPQSGYAYADSDYAEKPAFGRDRKSMEREALLSEMGVPTHREFSSSEAEAIELRLAVRRAERALEGKREREQYFKNKPYMRGDQERLEFLALDSYETRQRWLNARGISGTSTQHPPEIQALIDINDITLGMTKQAVRDSWGEPELVEASGNPMYGNERWHYSEQTSSTEGFRTQNRLVYFESGRVVGWESR